MPSAATDILCRVLLVAVALIMSPLFAHSQEAGEAGTETATPSERPGQTGLPLPRFVSLRAGEVNMRTGPGVRYPIDWVYNRRDLPVEVIDEFDTWRRIRDWQGTVGWVHQSMLQGRRTLLVTGRRLLRREPRDDAVGLAWVEAGVIGELGDCERAWCEVEVGGFAGWLKSDEFYGTYRRDAGQ